MTKVENIDNLQLVFYILKDLKEKRLPVAKFSREAGLNANNVYKWLDRGSVISFEDGIKVYKWAVKMDYSPKDWISSGEPNQSRFATLSDIELTLRELADAVNKIENKRTEIFSAEPDISNSREISSDVDKGKQSKKGKSDKGMTKT